MKSDDEHSFQSADEASEHGDRQIVGDGLTLQMLNVPIVGISVNGVVDEWNLKAANLLEYDKDDIMGRSFVDALLEQVDKTSVSSLLNQALLGHEIENEEVTLRSKSGKLLTVLLNTTTRRNARGQPKGVLGVLQDVTSYRQIITQSQRMTANMRMLFESAQAPVFGVDPRGCIAEWNMTASSMFGFTKEEILGQSFVDKFVSEDMQGSVRAVFERAQRGDDTDRFDVSLSTKDGEPKEILLSTAARLGPRGDVLGVMAVGQDVSEMRSLSHEWQRKADDMFLLVENANALIFVTNVDGVVTEWNRKAVAMTKFSKEEVIGQHFIDRLIQPESQPTVREVFSKALYADATEGERLPFRSRDGEDFTLLLNITSRHDSKGNLLGIIGVGQEITALQQDITQLRTITAAHEFVADDLSRLIETANAPIFGVDLNGLVTEFNRKAADMLAFTKEETMGRKMIEQLIQPEHRDRVQEVFRLALSGVETADFELPLISKHGKQYTVLLNATPRRDAKDAVIGVIGVGQDITALNRAMAESKRVAADLNRLISSANAPIFGIDKQFQVTIWNEKTAEITGFLSSEAMGKHLVQKFIDEEHQAAVSNILSKALEGRETSNYELPLFTKSGDQRQILLNATAQRSAGGEIIGVVGVGQDITEIKAAISDKERIADDLSRLIETANAPIFGVDVNGFVTEWNQKAVSLLGYSKQETMGKSLVENFITDEFKESVNAVLNAALHGQEKANFELPLFTKDHQTRVDILLNATTRRGPNGDIVGVIGVGQDITDMRAVNEEKERIADDLSRLIETANAPIFGVDRSGMVTEWNQKAVSLLGYSKTETMGKSLVDNFITEEFRESVNEVLCEALMGKETANFEFPLFTKENQTRIDILLNATTRRGPKGEVVGVIGVGQDITEMRAAIGDKERIADDLSRLIETANAPIFGVDVNGMVTEWNQKAESLLGYSKEETMGESLVDNFIDDEFKQSVSSVLGAALQGQETANFEFPLFTKENQTRIDILLNATTRRGPKGQVVGVIGVGQDITQFRAAMGEKERIADDLFRLIETANAPIFGVDVDGMVTEWNQKAVSLSGYSKEETMGKSLVDNFIHEQFKASVTSVLREALRGQETANFEFPLFTKVHQTRIDILLNATTRRGPKGEVVGVIGVGQDITEMRAAIGEKERIADDLSRLIETANAPIFGVDVNGLVTEWNQKAVSLLGYSKEDTIGEALVDNFVTDEFRETVNRVLSEALRGQERANFEFPLFTKYNHTRVDILLNATTRRGPKGEVVGVIGVGQDITQMRAAIGEKERIADDLSRLIETANAPIFGVDVNGMVTEWNQKAERVSGYGKDETMGKSLVDNFIDDEFKESVNSVLRAALCGKETANFEFPLFTKENQTRIDILLNATTRRGPKGEVVGVIGVGQDITEMRAAIGEKERIADDLSRLIETANAPIFGVDINGMVTEWNQKAVSLLGYSKEDTLGKALVDNFITEEFRESVSSVLKAALQGQETANFEFPLFTKEHKNRVDILLNATTRRGPKGEVVGVIGVGQDFTEMRAAIGEKVRIADDLSRLIETANAPIFGVDVNGLVTEWNQKAVSLLGYSKEDTMGKALVDNFITDEFRATVNSVLGAALRGQETANFEFPLFTKEYQTRVDILLNATTRRGPRGEVVGVIGVGQDITEMRAAIGAKERIADDLSRLIETANAPIFGVDIQGMVTEWNQKAVSLLGYSKEETMGMSLVDNFINPEFRESVSSVLTAALNGVETANFEFPLFTKNDQTRIDILLNATTRRGPKGDVVGVIGVGQDITEMRAAVAEQERIADDLSRLIETANAPIIGVDVNGMVTEWNQKAVSLLGYSKEETMGKSLADNFINKDFREQVNSVLTEALNGRETANFEFPLFTKDDQTRIDILLNATTRRGPKGEVVGVIGVGQDITEMRAAVAEQERIADDLSRLIETANAPIFGVDVNGLVTEWNQKAVSLLGYSKGETMGMSLVDNFINPEFRESVKSVITAALNGREKDNFEFPLFTKDDQTRIDILLNATTRRGPKGEVVGVIGVGQDITQMRAAVAEQERIADDLSRLIETANAPIFGVDVNGMVTEWNQKAVFLLGYSKEETMGKSLVDNFIDPEWRGSVNSVLIESLNGRETANFEFPLFTKDDQTRIDILLNATTRRGPKGEVVGVIGVGQDITEMRAAVKEQGRIADDLSRLIETANAPIFGVDVNGMVTEWNEKAVFLSGYSKEETMGKSLVDSFISLEFRESVNSVLTAALNGRERSNYEFPLFTKHDQTRIDILLNATTRRGPKGEVVGVIGVGQDITEMRAAVKENERIADDLSRLIETANAPIFGVDTNGMVTEWNQKAVFLLGYSKAETMGKSLVDNFISVEFRSQVNSVLTAALNGRETANFEFPLFTKNDQTRIDILLNATTRRGPKGEVVGVIGVGQDITEMRAAVAEQERIADDLSRLIETANAPIFGVDVHGLVTEWNQKAVSLLGYSKEETIGMSLVNNFINPEFRESVNSVLTAALQGQETANFEFPLFTKSDQTMIRILLNATTRRGPKGEVIGVIGVGQDITDLRAAVAEQERIADDLSRLIETANAPIFGVDVNGLVTEWNQKAVSLLEYSKEETMGKHLVDNFITDEYRESVSQVLTAALHGEETANFEFPLYTKGCHRLDILLNATTRRGPKGEVVGVIGVGQDITKMRAAVAEQERIADDLSRLIETANAPIFGVDVNGLVTEWNQKAAQLLGFSKEETMGESLVNNFITEEFRESVNSVLTAALHGKETANFEFPLFTKINRTRIDILLNATTRRGPKGEVVGVIGVGQDITKMRAAVAEQERIADDLSRLIETANAPIFGVDIHGMVTEWNQKAASLLGYSKEETMGKNLVANFIAVEWRESVSSVLTAALQGEEKDNFEFPLFTKNSQRIDILLHATTRRGAKGEVVGVIGVGQDITQMRAAVAEQVRIADDLSRLIETANAPIFGVDMNGLVTEWNQKAAFLLGFSKEETMGKSLVNNFITDEFRDSVNSVFSAACQGDETADFEFPLFTKGCQRIDILLNATTRRGPKGEVVGVIGVGQDITRLRAAVAEQERIADDLSRLIETANAPIFGVDCNGMVTEWNQKAAYILQYSKEETMGKSLVENFITEEFRESVNEVLTAALHGEETANFEFPLFTKSDQRVDILLNATTRRGKMGEVVGVIGVGQDITKMRAAVAEQKRVADDLFRLIETANAPIFGVDVNGLVTEWNQKAASLLGYSKEETMGKSLVDNFITEEFRSTVNSVLMAALHGKETANFEFPLFTKEGHQRIDILLNATTRRGPKGEIVGVIGVGQDITEMRAAVAEQMRVADDLSRLIETANAPIFGVDMNGMVTEWNQKVVSLLGFSKEETMGRSLVNNFITEEFRDSVNAVLQAACSGQETANFEFPLFTKSCQRIDILLNATTRRGQKGEVVGVIGVGQDITKMRAAVAEQERIADDLSRLIETANAPIFGVDVRGLVTEWNQKAVLLLGYSKEETMGKSLIDNFIDPAWRQSVNSVLTAALNGRETANFEFPLFTKDDQTRIDILLNATTRRGPKGEVVGVIGVGQDITEMRAAVAEQERIADDLSRLIETANAPIFGVDVNGMVTEWNQKAVFLLGYSKEETMGKSLVDNFISLAFRESVNSVLTAALNGRETANFEFPLFTKDDQTRIDILLNATTRRGPKGEVVGVIGVGQDITEMRAAVAEQERIADDLSRLIETANAPIFGVDVHGMVTEFNQKAVLLLGYSKEETMGKSLIDNFIDPAWRESVNSVLTAALNGRETANFEFPLFTKDDQTRIDILLNATTRRGPKGEVVGVIGVGQDITEMRAAVAEQERIADDLSRLIETANAPIFGVDVNGMVTEWNQKAVSLLGYSKEETMGMSLIDNFITAEFRESVKSVITAALNGREKDNFEFPLFTKTDRTRIDILLNATTRRGPKGEVVGVIGVGQDITELRAAVAEQGRIADDLSRLIETANAPIFGVDVNGMVTEWNQKAVFLLGYSKEETMGKSLVDNFINPEFRESVNSVLTAALNGRETANFEFPLFTKDDQTRIDILLNATTRRGPKGEVVGVIGVGQDITEMRAAVAEQERIADDLSRLIETANAPIFGVDVNGMVTEWNQKAVLLLGYSKEETMGKSLIDNFIDPEWRESVNSVLTAALNGRETANFEFPLFTKDDQTRIDILLNATTRRGPKGEVVGVIGVGQDITEMRAAVAEQERIADDLSRLIETANAPIFGVDVNGMVTEWNQKAVSLLGYGKQETMGMSLVDNFINPEFRESVNSVITAALNGREKDNFEFPLFTKTDKTRIDILLNATTRRGPKGEVVGVIGVGQDITQMRAAVAEQERIADDLSRLIETANAPIFGVDLDGMVTEWNQKAVSLLGYSKGETMGKSLVDNFITEEFRESVNSVLTAALQGQETANFEFPLFTKSRQRIDILLNATTRRGQKGEVVGVIGVGQDITEMRAAVAERMLVADDLSRLIDTANAPIFGIDTLCMVTEWNQKAASLLGYSKEETIGKSLVDNFITEEFRESVSSVLKKALEGEETANFEFPLFTKDTYQRIDILLNATTRRGPKGEVVGVIGVGQDITEMRVANAEKARVADDLSRVIETANAPIFGVDLNLMVTEWNQKAARLLGRSKEETMGRHLVDNFITSEFRASVNEVLTAALNGCETDNFEFPLYTKTGGRIDVLLNATTRRGPKGDVVGVIGVGQDITEMRAANSEKVRIADDLSRLIETANAPIFGVDINGMVTEWNQKAVNMLGYEKDETMNQNFVQNFIQPEYRHAVAEVFLKAQSGVETANFELQLVSKFGKQYLVLLNATTRRDSTGQVTGVVGVGQDITELNKAVAQSKQAADDLTRLIATANAPIFGIDVAGKLVTWNKKTAAITGISANEALGRSLVENFIHEDYRKSVREVLNKALAGEETANYELPLFTKDGDRREILLNATAQRSASGAIIGVVGVGQDITDLKQASLASKSIAEDLTRLIETANAPIFGIDIEYRVTEWNAKAANVTGFSKHEAVGNHLVNTFLDVQCRSSVLEVLTHALYGEGSANVELILFTKCGQKRDVLLNATPRRGPDGQIVGVIGVGQDITELNLQRREALRTADDLSRLIQTANAPIFGVDIQGQVTEWNDKLAELSHLNRYEVLGRPLIQNFITEQYRGAMADILLKALSGVETSNFEFPLVKNDQQTALLLLNATTRRGPSGNIIGVIGVGQDITQIRAMAAEHQRVADDLSRIIENANAPIFGVDLRGVVTEWNRQAAALSGFSKSEAMGVELVQNFIQPQDRESVSIVLEKAKKGAETANYKLPLVSKTGTCSTVLLNATTRRDASGNITGVIGVGQDITTLNKIMAETQLIADDLKRFVETANAPIFGIDTKGNVTEWNRMTSLISQFSKEEALGKALVDNFIAEGYTQKVSSVLNQALKGVETANFEFQLCTKYLDSKIQILANATPRRGPDGSVIGVIGVGQDVTHLQEAKLQAENTADELARFIEFANAPIFGVDKKGQITEWNRMMGKVSGVPRSEALGLKLVDHFLLNKNAKTAVSKVLNDAMEGVEIEHFELRLRKRSREDYFVQEVTAPKADFAVLLINATARLNAAGRIVGVTGVGQDITEITSYKALEDRKMRFIAMVSHELASPIHGINGLAESLGETESDAKRKKQLGLIRSCASRLIGLVTAIMDYAFMKAKTFRLNMGVCNVNTVMEEICELLHHAIDKHGRPVKRKGVELINNMDPTTPEIEADAHRCTQVLHNLVMNALKFTTQGSVTVTSDYHEDHWIQVNIIDTGIGIDKRHVERIFEPFEQEDDSDTRVFQGIGLGLPISRELARRHGGDIAVRTEVGKGSTFTLTLPVKQSESGFAMVAERQITMSMQTLPEVMSEVMDGTESSFGVAGMDDIESTPQLIEEDPLEEESQLREGSQGSDSGLLQKKQLDTQPQLTAVPPEDSSKTVDPTTVETLMIKESSTTDSILAQRSSIEAAEKFLAPWAERRPTILVVDDSPVNQEVMFQILTADGYIPARAMSGDEALGILTSCDILPDLVLMDVSMPELSGVQVCEKIRNELKMSAADLKIMMMSAKIPIVQTCVDCLAAGCNDFIARPFAHEEFRARVRSLLTLRQSSWKPVPPVIQKRVLTGERKIIEKHAKVSFLFAGIADWAEISETLDAKQIVRALELFDEATDKLAIKYETFIIETGGEVCLAVAGNDNKPEACKRLVLMAVDMLKAVSEVRMPKAHRKLQIRVGIHSGPAWSALLNKKCPQYCFFDHTIKVASRLESLGVTDCIHITSTALEELRDRSGKLDLPPGFRCNDWSLIQVKKEQYVPTSLIVAEGKELPLTTPLTRYNAPPNFAKQQGSNSEQGEQTLSKGTAPSGFQDVERMMAMFAGNSEHEKLERQILEKQVDKLREQVWELKADCRKHEEEYISCQAQCRTAAAQVDLLKLRLQSSEKDLVNSKGEVYSAQRKGQHLSLALETVLKSNNKKSVVLQEGHAQKGQ